MSIRTDNIQAIYALTVFNEISLSTNLIGLMPTLRNMTRIRVHDTRWQNRRHNPSVQIIACRGGYQDNYNVFGPKNISSFCDLHPLGFSSVRSRLASIEGFNGLLRYLEGITA
jgi:hypothetical protein